MFEKTFLDLMQLSREQIVNKGIELGIWAKSNFVHYAEKWSKVMLARQLAMEISNK